MIPLYKGDNQGHNIGQNQENFTLDPPLSGLGSNFRFSWFWHSLIVLIMKFSKWAHLFLNSQRLLRYDVIKLAITRSFSGKCMEKSEKMLLNFA